MKKELYLYKGSVDWDGSVISEDRYIIVDDNGMDTTGQHFTEDEANELISYYYV